MGVNKEIIDMCTMRELRDFIFQHWGFTSWLIITPKGSEETDQVSIVAYYNDYVVYGFSFNETTNKVTVRAKERING